MRTANRMKRLAAAVGAALLTATTLVACGDDDSTTGTESPATTDTSTTAVAVAAEDVRAAILTIGNSTDGAFGQSLFEGGEEAADALGIKVDYVGNLFSPDQYVAQGSAFAEDGYDFILLGHGGVGQVAVQLAEQFPDTTFCMPTLPFELGELPSNTCFFFPRGEVGAFRAGALAGLITETDHVASNQSLVFPGLTMQVEAFRLGAECVNSSVRVSNAVTNEDVDPVPTKTASEAQIADGADVLFGATGPAINGMFQAASDSDGSLAIGQYVDSTGVAPDVIIASAIVNFQETIPYVIKQFINGELPSVQTIGLDAPIEVGYLVLNESLYGAIPSDVRHAYEEVADRISSGEIRVPTVDEIGQPGSAETIDVSALGCEPA
jgi:basic membrane protein A